MRRVARRRIVLFTIDAEKNSEIWPLRASSLWHGHLRTLPELDIGLRLVREEL